MHLFGKITNNCPRMTPGRLFVLLPSRPSNLIVVDCCVASGRCIFHFSFFIVDCCGAGSWPWEGGGVGWTQATGCRTRSLAEGRSFLLTPGADWVTPECAGGGGALGMSGLGGELWRKHASCFSCFSWSTASLTSVREPFLALGGHAHNTKHAVPFQYRIRRWRDRWLGRGCSHFK